VVGTPTPLKNDGRIASWDDFPFPFLNGKMKKKPNHQPGKNPVQITGFIYIYIYIYLLI